MGHDVKFIVLNSDEHFGAELRSMLLKQEGVKVVAEVDEPALLSQAVQQFPVDVVFVNLDPVPDVILPMIGETCGANRNLAVFAASESTDGQLILKAMRTGVREFFPRPIDEAALREAIGKIAVGRVATGRQGRLITVVGASGGVGATLISTNLAVELAAIAEGQVTLVDLDYRYGQVATFLDLDPKYSLADLCGSPEVLEPQVIGRALMQHTSGVQVLGRPNHFAEADSITAAACMGVFAHLLQMNAYVVADGPTRSDADGKSVLALADVLLLVVLQSVPSVRNALRLMESLRDAGYNLDRLKLVVNRGASSRSGSEHLSPQDISATLSTELFSVIPNDPDHCAAAINLGEPLAAGASKSKVRLGILEMAQRLHAPSDSADERTGGPATKKPTLLGRLFAPS